MMVMVVYQSGWTIQLIFDLRYQDNPNDTHPSEYTHEKFVDDVILNWEIFDK